MSLRSRELADWEGDMVRLVEHRPLSSICAKRENVADFDRFHFLKLAALEMKLRQNFIGADFFVDGDPLVAMHIDRVFASVADRLELIAELRERTARGERAKCLRMKMRL